MNTNTVKLAHSVTQQSNQNDQPSTSNSKSEQTTQTHFEPRFHPSKKDTHRWTTILDIVSAAANDDIAQVTHVHTKSHDIDGKQYFQVLTCFETPWAIYESSAWGPNKLAARDESSKNTLELAYIGEESTFSKLDLPDWVREALEKDLTTEGIEPNPGPGSIDSGHTMYFALPREYPVQTLTQNVSETRGFRTGARYYQDFYFRQNNGNAGNVRVQWDTSVTAGMAAGSILVPNGFATGFWTAGPFTNLRFVPSAGAQGTIVANFYEYNLANERGKQMHIGQTGAAVPTAAQGVTAVSGGVIVSGAVSITDPVLDVKVTNSVTEPVRVTGIVQATVTNADPIPVSVSGTLTVAPLIQEPVWVTEVQPRRLAPPPGESGTDDLTKDGDVEANPGPCFFEEAASIISFGDNHRDSADPFEDATHTPSESDIGIYYAEMKPGRVGKPNLTAGIDIKIAPDTFAFPHVNSPELEVTVEERGNKATREQLVDHLKAKSKCGNQNVSRYFKELLVVFNVETRNGYAELDTMEGENDTEPDGMPIRVRDRRKDNHPPQGDADPRRDQKPKKVDRPEPIVAQKTGERNLLQERQQYENVVARIVAKLKEKKELLPGWLVKQRSTRFKRDILARILGDDWEQRLEYDQYDLLCFAHINNVSEDLLQCKMLSFDSAFSEYRHLVVSDSTRANMEAARLHNKVMHALNGNGIIQGMKDVDAAPGWKSMLRAPAAHHKLMQGYELQTKISNLRGNENINQSDIFAQDRLRANFITRENDVVRNGIVTLPSTNLIPRNIVFNRPGGGQDVVPDPYGALVTEVQVQEYYARPLRPTGLSGILVDTVANNQTSNWRRDNSTLAGFSSLDVYSVNTAVTYKGFSKEQIFLKLDLFHSIMALKAPANVLGQSNWGVINNTFSATPGSIVSMGINDSPNADERCGGNDPVFPWLGGKGQIRFHLTLQSVPIDARADAIFMPPALLSSTRNRSAAVFLFAMMWSEWPFCMYNPLKTVSYSAPPNPEGNVDIRYGVTQCFTRVPGFRTLDIILPRQQSEANPTNQNAANALAAFIPTTGSQASANLGAFVPMPINFVGPNPVQGQNLVDYLYTWANDLDITTIRQFLGALTVMVGASDTLNVVHDINIALCQQIPEMFLTDGTPQRIIPSSEAELNTAEWNIAFHQRCYVNHARVSEPPTRPGPPLAKFPIQTPTPADMRVCETSVLSWNRVVLGLSESEDTIAETTMEMPAHIGDYRTNYWERLQAIPMTIAWAIYYATSGMTSNTWDQGYDSTTSRWVQTRLRNTFCTESHAGALVPAKYGIVVRKFYEGMFERSPAIAPTTYGSKVIEVTHFDRWLPAEGFAKVWSPPTAVAAPIQTSFYVPTLLPDVWIQHMAKNVPRFANNFPLPGGTDSAGGYSAGLKVHRTTAANRIIAPYMEVGVEAAYAVDEGPEVDDEIKWNYRLWLTSDDVQISDFAGGNLTEVPPPPGQLPTGRFIVLNPREQHPTELLNQSTICLPDMDADSERVVPWLPTALAAVPIQACNRVQQLEFASFLLNDVNIEPEIQAKGGKVSIFDAASSDFQDTVVSPDVPATPATVAQGTVDPASLPTSQNPSTTIVPPEPLVLRSEDTP